MDNRFDFTERRLRQLPVPEKVRARYYDDKSPGLVLAVSPKGKRTFTYFRQIAGKLHCARLGEFPEMSITAARAEAGRLNGEILNGRNLSAEREQERKEPTFREAFEQYVESHATNRNNRRTVADKRRSFENYVSEELGDKKLSEVSKSDVSDRYNALWSGIGLATANRTLALVKAVFNWAIEMEMFDGRNPAKQRLTAKEEARRRMIEDDELPRFRAALLTETNVDFRAFVLLALATGQRSEAIRRMRWENVDLQKAVWHSDREKPEHSKRVPETVYLNKLALQTLQARSQTESPYVFPGRKGRNPGFVRSFKTAWATFCKKADLVDSSGKPTLRIHDLRRTFAMFQKRQRVPLNVTRDALGHAPVGITDGVYQTADASLLIEANELAAKYYLTAGTPLLTAGENGIALTR